MRINKMILVLLVSLLSISPVFAGNGLTTLKNSLGAIVLATTLTSVTLADEGQLIWKRVTDRSPATHRTVFLLDIELESHRRQMPLVMVGKDRSGRHLFIGARFYLLSFKFNGELIFDDALSIDLYGYDGLVSSNMVVGEIESFIRPDKALNRSYDVTILAIESEALNNYPVARLANFPELMTPLDIVIYEPGGRGWRAWHSECRIRRRINRWMVASDCVVPLMENEWVDYGAPVFVNSTSELVGLQVEASEVKFPAVSAIPKELQVFLDIELPIDSGKLLPTTWSKLKIGR